MSEESVNKPEILVVDDSKVIRLAAKKMLGSDYEIHLAEDGLIGWEMLQQNSNISVVFSDLIMPNLSGMELLENIRSSGDDHIANLPVIIMTGHDDSESGKQKVFDAGATDFVSKPFESIDLVSRAKSYARLSRKVVELEKKTGYDKLTGLYNAHLLEEQGAKAFSFADRHKLYISAAYFEIKDFQDFFLNYGKNVAQHIIVAVGKRLQDVMREEDIAARLGVAKYALILPMTNKHKTELVITRVRESINKLVFDTGKEKIRVNFVAGYSSSDLNGESSFAEMTEQAEDALQRAIISSTESVICFDDEIEIDEPEVVITEQDIEQAFTHILEGNFYQIPETHLATVVERFSPFMQYAENQAELELSDDSTESNIAL
ncbi:MAG: response regulator [Gammaproteobacteria bacterium]|jgi:diguanylate cyclase (GGDEF)-like protein|nr:response regulator [Gammaproteobacteria bacterium]